MWVESAKRKSISAVGGRPQRGFTVVEMLVVVCIVAILSLMAVGSYSNLRKNRATRGAADMIKTAMGAARSYAITTNGYYRLTFQLRDPNTNAPNVQYWIDEVFQPNLSPTDINEFQDYRYLAGAYAPGQPNVVRRPKVTAPQPLPAGVAIGLISTEVNDTASIGVGNGAADTTGNPTYISIVFEPTGQSDSAQVQLVDPTVSAAPAVYSEQVLLSRPTGKAVSRTVGRPR